MKVLFIGNSHTYYNSMPQIFSDLFKATGKKIHVTMLCEGGTGLIYHCKRKDTRFNIKHGDYDCVVLQDKATNFNEEEFFQGGVEIRDKYLSQTNSKPVLYMVWARRDEIDNQERISAANERLAKEINAKVAPAGEVWHKILRDNPDMKLYREDGCHAHPLGSYLAAVTLFYTISGRKRPIKILPDDEPNSRLGIDIDTCKLIHREACNICRTFEARENERF